MRIRLKADFDISGFSPANQVILTAMKQYGMILADNGGYFYFQGAPDPRWDDNDLNNLDSIGSENFEVVQMNPDFPGWDSATAPTGNPPVINSFTASATSASAGSPVTFGYNVSGDTYDYIDMIGPVKAGSGSVTIYPTATQTYTLYSMNQYGDNGSGIGYGEVVSTPITVTVPDSVVAPPVFAPPPGQYTGQLLVTLATPTSPYAAIYFTTDGSTPTYPLTGTTQPFPVMPTPPNSQGSAISLTVTPTKTVKAIAVVSGYAAPSAVSSATYTLAGATVTPPIFSLSSGTYHSAQTLMLSDTTRGATIYYTTDGSTPTYPMTGTTIKYSSSITVATSGTVNAIAAATGDANSPMASAGYNIVPPQVAVPAFSLAAGSYTGTQTVSISDATANAVLYYTINGSTPTTASSVYSAGMPITVSTSETLRAMATLSGYTNSQIPSAAYTIATATPTFSPTAGNYGQAQTVTISDATPNATIYYTTNGNTPTTNSSVYNSNSPITVSATETLEAIATASGCIQSQVGSAAFAIATTVTPTITWKTPAAIIYGTALTAAQLDASASVAGSFSYSPALGTILAAGQQSLTVAFKPSNTALYNTAASTVALTVNPATLTVTANNLSMVAGATVPALAASYNGFIPGDSASVLQGSPVLSTTATRSSPAGIYPITIAQGTLAAANYSFAFVNGTITVTSAATAKLSSTATLTVGSGGYQAIITVTNTGAGAAVNAQLTTATLGSATVSALPVTLGTIAANGGSSTVTVNFPASASSPGAAVVERLAVAYTGGSFSAASKVTLP
jgi:hypothetical protein